MTCSSCQDKGIIRLNWADAPEDFALCLCRVGQVMRSDVNHGRKTSPRWYAWCGMNNVDVSRVVLIEDVLTPAELSERGFHTAEPEANREAALLAASRKRR